jgi:hypothetical protein
MPGRLFIVAAAVSLVTCVATLVMWVRSQDRHDGFRWVETDGEGSAYRLDWVAVRAGGLSVGTFKETDLRKGLLLKIEELYPARGGFYERRCAWDYSVPPESTWNRLGFWRTCADRHDWDYDASLRRVEVPLWLLAVMFAVLPGIVFIPRVRRGRAVGPGTCRSCGYDLRATPGRCPECGTVPEAE